MAEPIDRLTWAALLGRWVEFARGALAWPQDGDGALLRASVGDLIMLQAVTFALEHLGELDPAERALGVDRATILIDRHASALRERWGDRMPPAMRELIDAARDRLVDAERGNSDGSDRSDGASDRFLNPDHPN